MMNTTLGRNLKSFGLDSKQISIYLTLLRRGRLTNLEIARHSGINRTTVYRFLETLKEIGLVEEVIDENTTYAQAVDPSQLQLIIKQKEAEIIHLKTVLPTIISELSVLEDKVIPSTKVVYFRGIKGLQQLLWNTLKAKGEQVGFGYLNWNDGVGQAFAEKLREEYVIRKVHLREILNEVDEKGEYTSVNQYFNNYYQHRMIPKEKLEIKHDTYIYNDVFAFYHIYKGELFGVEIHNAEIAKTQKQMFEILWEQSQIPATE
jgi:sugar-specific transcriptional regulator TrmB